MHSQDMQPKSVQDAKLDEQHRKIIEQIRRIKEAIDLGIELPSINIFCERLKELLETHFSEEEKYFENLEHEKSLSHKLEHKKYSNQVNCFIDAIKFSDKKICSFLAGLLYDFEINHIEFYDSKLTGIVSKVL